MSQRTEWVELSVVISHHQALFLLHRLPFCLVTFWKNSKDENHSNIKMFKNLEMRNENAFSEGSEAEPVQGKKKGRRPGSATCVQSARVLGRQKWKKNFEDDDDGQKWHDLIWGFPRIFLVFVNFNFLKNLVKWFFWIHILCLLFTVLNNLA